MLAQGAAAQERSASEIVVTANKEQNQPAIFLVDRVIEGDSAAAYGASSIGELLEVVDAEMGESDRPLLMVNGVPVADEGDIVDYPVGAIERLEILPRGSGARFGGRTDQRAFNIVLKRVFKTHVAEARAKVATEGGWIEGRSDWTLTRISGERRLNVTAQVRRESQLLESERGVLQPIGTLPFDITGNIVADPRRGSNEIDPLLSAATGQRTILAGVPEGNRLPTLSDFAQRAGVANETDQGRFRSLRPSSRSYDLSVNAGLPLAPWARASLTGGFQHNEFVSLQGPRAGLFVLGSGNPASPFSVPVAIARFFEDEPLLSESESQRGHIVLSLNANVGKWLMSASGEYAFNTNDTRNGRQIEDAREAIVLPEDINPFAARLDQFAPVATVSAASGTYRLASRYSATGPIATLPAGAIQLNLSGEWQRIEQRSQVSNELADLLPVRSERFEQTLQAGLEVPVFSRGSGAFGVLGDLSVTLDRAVTQVRRLGSLDRVGYAASWEPLRGLSLRGSINRQSLLADLELVDGPVILTEGYRFFNPLTGEVVDVTELSGGNPELKGEELTTKRLSGVLSMLERGALQLTAEYIAVRRKSPISLQLPASAELLRAFPERLLRDGNGVLVQVDTRPVNLDRIDSEQLRWGGSFTRRFSATQATKQASAVQMGPAPQLQLTFSHSIQLSERAVPRAGSPAADLLRGGGLGFGGGTSRHRVDIGVNLSGRTGGFRINGNWRSAAFLNVAQSEIGRLRFSPIGNVNLVMFAELGQLFPGSSAAKNTRISVSAFNLANQRQTVTDSNGETPLAYQSVYRDPLGRTIELALRKAF